jgi:hypothetical protein
MNKHNLEEMQRLRNRTLQDMSSCMESYMRSPAFLELMRYNMVMMSNARRVGIPGSWSLSETARRHSEEGPVAGVPPSVPPADHQGGGAAADASAPALAMMDHSKALPAGESPSAVSGAKR